MRRSTRHSRRRRRRGFLPGGARDAPRRAPSSGSSTWLMSVCRRHHVELPAGEGRSCASPVRYSTFSDNPSSAVSRRARRPGRRCGRSPTSDTSGATLRLEGRTSTPVPQPEGEDPARRRQRQALEVRLRRGDVAAGRSPGPPAVPPPSAARPRPCSARAGTRPGPRAARGHRFLSTAPRSSASLLGDHDLLGELELSLRPTARAALAQISAISATYSAYGSSPASLRRWSSPAASSIGVAGTGPFASAPHLGAVDLRLGPGRRRPGPRGRRGCPARPDPRRPPRAAARAPAAGTPGRGRRAGRSPRRHPRPPRRPGRTPASRAPR